MTVQVTDRSREGLDLHVVSGVAVSEGSRWKPQRELPSVRKHNMILDNDEIY